MAAGLRLTLTLGAEEGAGADLTDMVSSSVSVSVRGSDGGIAGATSKRPRGHLSHLLCDWLRRRLRASPKTFSCHCKPVLW